MSPSPQNDIWEVTLPFVSGDTIEYKFSADDWSIQETNDPTEIVPTVMQTLLIDC